MGKTTCAAAIALAAASARQRVLVASTDPAPSLGDALKVTLGSQPRPVRPNGRLEAVEIDAARSLARWLKRRRRALEEIAVQGTWLEHDDVTQLLRLSLPGIDEIAALLEISQIAGSRRYDLVVIDAAPTGHTLRMLAMPATMAAIAAVFDRMREKRRVMEEALRGAWRAGAEDALIEEIAATAQGLSDLLRDPDRTRFSWVTLAEPMAVAETHDAVDALEATGIRVTDGIVNRLTPVPNIRCGHCDARRALEQRAIGQLPHFERVAAVSTREVEPRGPRHLRAVAREIGVSLTRTRRIVRSRHWRFSLEGTTVRPLSLVSPTHRLVMIGGKGGVGKTTCAAGIAVAAADADPEKRILLISTDPAHSLSDALGGPGSDTLLTVPGGPANLGVREMDAASFLTRIRERYVSAVNDMFGSADRRVDLSHDRAVMTSLIDLAPPGLDEVAAVLETTDALLGERSRWDLVVMDTAPTGHALRLLQMPALIQDWARALMRILLKYQQITGLGEFGKTLLALSTSVGRLRQLLADADRCGFIVVTRAAALPRLETQRLMTSLAAAGVHVPAVVINAVGYGRCRRCVENGSAQKREIAAMRKRLAGQGTSRLIVTAAEIPPPHGVAALRRWSTRSWHSTSGYHQGR